jgi:hypothetical protein
MICGTVCAGVAIMARSIIRGILLMLG